jgi:uncharacterized membrane protein
MHKGRLEAFSDGVIAIIITIMVLELHVPHGADWAALRPLLPALGTYVLSFVFLGIYWNNHHHLLHTAERVNGVVLWANLHLLFWLSLVPFVTGWTGENHFASIPTFAYGVVFVMAGIAYQLLERAIIRAHGPGSRLHQAIGDDWKGKLSLAAYVAALPLAFVDPRLSWTIFVLVALVWFMPDRRIERVFR